MSDSALQHALEEAIATEGPLSRKLGVLAERMHVLAPAYVDHYDRIVARLSAARTGMVAPGPGDRMPDFALPGLDGRIVALDEFLAHGPVAVTFKRGHWCEFCRIEIDGLTRAYPAVRELGGEVVAILPEAAPALAVLQREARVPFPLLIDMGNVYALELGIAMSVDDSLQHMLKADGIDLRQLHGDAANALLPLPATFVVAPDRKIVARFVDPDFRKRMETSDIIATLKSISASGAGS